MNIQLKLAYIFVYAMSTGSQQEQFIILLKRVPSKTSKTLYIHCDQTNFQNYHSGNQNGRHTLSK